MSEYVAEAVKNNPQVLQEVHRYRQGVQDYEIAHKGWRPSVDLSASVGKYQTKSPITGQQTRDYDSDYVQLTVTQNLFAGYDTTNEIKQGESRLNAMMYTVYDTADNVALDAARAYLEALKQQRLLKLAEENVEEHEQIYAQIEERTKSGVGRRSEMEQTAGRLAQARAGLIAQRNNLEDSLSALHRLLGRYLDSKELEEPAALPSPDGTLDQALDLAIQNHPAVRISLFNVSAAESNYERSKSTNLPRIDLQLMGRNGHDLNGYDGPTDEWGVMLNLSYNLYNGGADLAEQRKRVSSIYENTEFSNQVRRQVIESLRLAWLANDTLDDQIQYLTEHVEKSGQTANSYQEEVLLGQRDLTDLLDVKSEHNRAQRSLAEAQMDLLSARLRIHEGLGQLFGAMGLDVNIDDGNMKIFNADVNTLDQLPVNMDRDEDKHLSAQDQCDTSLPGVEVNEYGCIEKQIFIENLNFVYDTAELVPASKQRLKAVVARLQRIGPDEIMITAHTDWNGSDAYNQELSERRANSVRQQLITGGLDGSIIKAFGKGEAEPVADNHTTKGRAKNRRVEFTVIRHLKGGRNMDTKSN